MKILRITLLLAVVAAAGCHTEMVHVTLINTSSQPLATIVVDYPGATFGVNQLGPGKTFQYNIKPLDTGPLKIQFTDAAGHDHAWAGPSLHKNDKGAITVRLTQDAATAEPALVR
jgi:hypothetical protein